MVLEADDGLVMQNELIEFECTLDIAAQHQVANRFLVSGLLDRCSLGRAQGAAPAAQNHIEQQTNHRIGLCQQLTDDAALDDHQLRKLQCAHRGSARETVYQRDFAEQLTLSEQAEPALNALVFEHDLDPPVFDQIGAIARIPGHENGLPGLVNPAAELFRHRDVGVMMKQRSWPLRHVIRLVWMIRFEYHKATVAGNLMPAHASDLASVWRG